MKAAVLFCLLAVAYATPIERELNDKDCGKVKIPKFRIVGGSTAEKGAYPWIGSLRYRQPGSPVSRHICGCSIIDDQWILSAAHCFINSQKAENYIIRIGTHNQTAGASEVEAVEHEVEKVIQHEDFGMTFRIKNDIAVLKLAKKIDFSSMYVNRVCLPTAVDYNTDDKVLQLAGWGDEQNAQGKKIPQLLKQTELVAHKDDVCKSKWGSYMWAQGQMLCAEAPNTSPCVGDSGGPLVNLDESGRYFQVGVVSFGERSCAGPRPGVFTRNSYFIDWIRKQMANNP
jgi:secreted trypsin-like serine protease